MSCVRSRPITTRTASLTTSARVVECVNIPSGALACPRVSRSGSSSLMKKSKPLIMSINLIAFWGRRELDPQGLLMNSALGVPGPCGVSRSERQKQATKEWNATEASQKARLKGNRASVKVHSQNWVLTDPAGNDYCITNLSQFCREKKLHRPNLTLVAQGN